MRRLAPSQRMEYGTEFDAAKSGFGGRACTTHGSCRTTTAIRSCHMHGRIAGSITSTPPCHPHYFRDFGEPRSYRQGPAPPVETARWLTKNEQRDPPAPILRERGPGTPLFCTPLPPFSDRSLKKTAQAACLSDLRSRALTPTPGWMSASLLKCALARAPHASSNLAPLPCESRT